MAATFGAGLGYACVVDVGDQKTSVSCVEDGISHPNTRVSIFLIARAHSDFDWTSLKNKDCLCAHSENSFPWNACNFCSRFHSLIFGSPLFKRKKWSDHFWLIENQYSLEMRVYLENWKKRNMCMEWGSLNQFNNIHFQVRLEYGGADVTQAFHWLLKKSAFPYKDYDERRPQDAILMKSLKEEFCHVNLVRIWPDGDDQSNLKPFEFVFCRTYADRRRKISLWGKIINQRCATLFRSVMNA